MNEQLESIAEEARQATDRLRRLASHLSPEAWKSRPASGGWSPGECVAHLNLTSEATLPRVREAVDELRRAGVRSSGRLRRDLLGWMLWKSQHEGGRMRSRTAPRFVPEGDADAERTVARFEALQEELISLLREADGLPLADRKIRSPFNEKVRYNLFSALSILTVHQHRHLAQAERAGGGAG